MPTSLHNHCSQNLQYIAVCLNIHFKVCTWMCIYVFVVVTLFCYFSSSYFLFCVDVHMCLRPATGNILWVSVLVLHLVLWAEPAGRGDIPCIAALSHCGRLHRSVQRWAILPGFAVQREPQHRRGAHTQTYRYDTSTFIPPLAISVQYAVLGLDKVSCNIITCLVILFFSLSC